MEAFITYYTNVRTGIRYVPGTGLITEAQRGIILLLPHFKYEKSGSIGICKKIKMKNSYNW